MKNFYSYKKVYHRNSTDQIDSIMSYENSNNSPTYYSLPNWELDDREVYFYNNQNLVDTIETEDWYGSWHPRYKATYNYDADGDLLTEIIQYESGGNYINSDKRVYTYAFPVSTDNELVEAVDCKFQNPYLSGSTLSCIGLTENKDYRVILHDVLGRQVVRQRITGNQPFSIQESIPMGMYILTIQDEEQLLFTEKIIVK